MFASIGEASRPQQVGAASLRSEQRERDESGREDKGNHADLATNSGSTVGCNCQSLYTSKIIFHAS